MTREMKCNVSIQSWEWYKIIELTILIEKLNRELTEKDKLISSISDYKSTNLTPTGAESLTVNEQNATEIQHLLETEKEKHELLKQTLQKRHESFLDAHSRKHEDELTHISQIANEVLKQIKKKTTI